MMNYLIVPLIFYYLEESSSSVLEALNRQRIQRKISFIFEKLQSSNNLLSYLTPKIDNPLLGT